MTFAPSTGRIYTLPVRMTIGFESHCPLAHQLSASYALPVPSGQSFACSFFPTPPCGGSSCCSARDSRSSGLPEDFHLQVTSRSAFARRLLLPKDQQARPRVAVPCLAHNKIAQLLLAGLKKTWQFPTLPPRLQGSTIGARGLNFRVRDGNGCDPSAIATRKNFWLLTIESRHRE